MRPSADNKSRASARRARATRTTCDESGTEVRQSRLGGGPRSLPETRTKRAGNAAAESAQLLCPAFTGIGTPVAGSQSRWSDMRGATML